MIGVKELALGMHVEVTNKYTSSRLNGMVTDIHETRKARFIDGKPIESYKVEVTISYDQGGSIILTDINYAHYQINVID